MALPRASPIFYHLQRRQQSLRFAPMTARRPARSPSWPGVFAQHPPSLPGSPGRPRLSSYVVDGSLVRFPMPFPIATPMFRLSLPITPPVPSSPIWVRGSNSYPTTSANLYPPASRTPARSSRGISSCGQGNVPASNLAHLSRPASSARPAATWVALGEPHRLSDRQPHPIAYLRVRPSPVRRNPSTVSRSRFCDSLSRHSFAYPDGLSPTTTDRDPRRRRSPSRPTATALRRTKSHLP